MKSYPFEFYRPISDGWKCIFIYKEDWTSDHDANMAINLGDDIGSDNWLHSDKRALYSYFDHEMVMDIYQAYDVNACICLSKPGSPIHSNSSMPGVVNVAETTGTLLLLDFYNQDPSSIPHEANYISVLGDEQARECIEDDSTVVNGICSLDINTPDLSEFCRCTSQTLRGINVICRDVLLPYLTFQPNTDDLMGVFTIEIELPKGDIETSLK